jgi:ribokinase
VIITDGDNGVHCLDDAYYYLKAKKVNVVEATGAGDAFASGFVAGKIQDRNTIYCLKLGMLNAESVIRYKGAKNILLGKEAWALAEKEKRDVQTNNYKNPEVK